MLSIRDQGDAVDDGAPNPQGHILLVVSAVFTTLSVVLAVARWIIRKRIHKMVGADDWVILAAVLVDIFLLVLSVEEIAVGFGLHSAVVDQSHIHEGMKYFLAFQVLFKAATTLTKVSILLLFLRIFPSKRFRIATWTTMAIVVAFGFAVIVASIVQCTPLNKAFDPQLPGTCIQVGDVWYATASFAIITDLVIIALPINQIPSLKLPRHQKIGLTLVFSIGFFCIVIEIIRICFLGPVTTSKDYTYYQASACLWADLEVNVGIICACTPMLKTPLVRLRHYLFPKPSSLRGSHVRSWPAPAGTETKVRSRISGNEFGRGFGKASDEEIMLEGTNGIVKTTNFQVIFHDTLQRDAKGGAGQETPPV